MWEKISLYAKKYPARLSGYVSAVVLYLNRSFPNLPTDLIIPSVILLIGLGETTQRVEDKKTIKALWTDNNPDKPDDEILDSLIERR